MFFRAKRAWNRAAFQFDTRSLHKAPPLRTTSVEVTIVSMICHGEVPMYLVAIASFCSSLGWVPRIVVMDDGSLTAEDRSTISRFLPDVHLTALAAVEPAMGCPRGGCWERLLLICDLVQDGYVIQLDSDTLTLGDLSEIREAITANRSFTLLGDGSWPAVEPMLDAWQRYRGNLDPKVQAVCERSFDQVAESAELLYLRGNAGFTGFAKGTISRDRIIWFSDRMRRIAAGTWDEWGSEQLLSNLLIANTPGSIPLPFPRYASYWDRPEVEYSKSVFLHFIGPCRFSHGLYRRLARQVLRSLRRRWDASLAGLTPDQ